MNTIIVSTDFSPVSINAVNFAVDMALATNKNILLFTAYHIPVAYTGEVPVALLSVEELQKGSEKDLEELKKKIEPITAGKIKVSTESRMGNTVDELETLCKKIQPFAVVMGAKGKTGMEKIVFGSTALTAIRHLSWPVICVPPGKKFGEGIRKIGFACEFKKVKMTTPVSSIKEMVKVFNAELHILNVDHNDKHFNPDTPDELYQINNLFSDINPQYHFINHPDIEDGILEFAQSNDLDLIIAIPKKHSLLDGIFRASSTKQLLFQSHIPVMCVHE